MAAALGGHAACRIPVIVDKVTTLVGPGELIDVVVTERGIAINPRRQDLIDAIKSSGSKLPIRTIQGRRMGDFARRLSLAEAGAFRAVGQMAHATAASSFLLHPSLLRDS